MTTDKQSSVNLNIEKVFMVSFGFFVIFIAYLSCQNFASKILIDLGYSNLGILSVAVIYLAFAFNAAAATKILNKLGMRLTLCISGLSYSIFIGSFLVPLYKYEKIQ